MSELGEPRTNTVCTLCTNSWGGDLNIVMYMILDPRFKQGPYPHALLFRLCELAPEVRPRVEQVSKEIGIPIAYGISKNYCN
jgi:hypothetical protein